MAESFKSYTKPALRGLDDFEVRIDGDIVSIRQITSSRKGVGRKAIAHLEAWARANGIKEIRGEAVPSSVGFWSHMGYQVSNRPNNFDNYPFKKNLLTSRTIIPKYDL